MSIEGDLQLKSATDQSVLDPVVLAAVAGGLLIG